MSDEIQIASSGKLDKTRPTQINLSQPGDNNTQIGYVNTFDATVKNTFVVLPQPGLLAGVPQPQNLTFNYDCFNLFVLAGETYEGKYFLVPKDRALTENTSQEMKKLCASLDKTAVEAIKSFPAIFADENHAYGKTDDQQIAYYGYVTDVKVQDNGIKIYFQILNGIRQQSLNELASQLCLAAATNYNEFNRTHWAIKRVNLVEVLNDAGINVFKL